MIKIIENHYTYWKVFYYIGAIWGYLTGIWQGIGNISYAWLQGNILLVILNFIFLNIFAMLRSMISGFLTAIIWGGLFFIPYLIIRKLL
jgi:hypothetical protein